MLFSLGVKYCLENFNDRMQRYGQKTPKIPPKWGFSPFVTPPKIFFQKSGSVTFVPLRCPNFMQKIRKKQWAVSKIFKDGRTDELTDRRTNGQGGLLWTPSGKPGVQNDKNSLICINSFINPLIRRCEKSKILSRNFPDWFLSNYNHIGQFHS